MLIHYGSIGKDDSIAFPYGKNAKEGKKTSAMNMEDYYG